MVSVWLEVLESLGLDPNFWCSVEYFQKAGWREYLGNDQVLVKDQSGEFMLPCLSLTAAVPSFPTDAKRIWSDLPLFADYGLSAWAEPEPLDWEFIYDPQQFLNLSGGAWATFRKNIRKWPRENQGWVYAPLTDQDELAIVDVTTEWLAGVKDSTIHDDEVMLSYLFTGEHRWGLFTETGTLVGINVYDSNYKYINFRYSICRSEPFVSEFLRWLFYTSSDILSSGKLVNDGGCLDREDLRVFKERLRPVKTRKVYSWSK